MGLQSLTVTRDHNHPDKVVFLMDGKYVCDMDWSIALEVAKIVRHVAKLAEEYAVANKLIIQDALLIRSGAPFALTNNRKIREASYNEAQWGKEAKRMPLAGVPSRKEVGAPSLIQHKGKLQ